MTSLFAALSLGVWQLSWQAELRRTRKLSLTLEQWALSLLTAMILAWLGQKIAWVVIIWMLLTGTARYANLLHLRFFGELASVVQIRQALRPREVFSIRSSMLIKAAGGLLRTRDVGYVLMLFVSALLLINPIGPFISQWAGLVTLNITLVGLLGLLLLRYSRIRRGQSDFGRYGMLGEYWLAKIRRRRLNAQRTALYQQFEQEEPETAASLNTQEEGFGIWKGMNVVLVQLESFQQILLHRKVEGQEITPFLNRLALEQISFTNVFSQYAAGHTADAELAALQSLFPPREEIVNYKFYDRHYKGLPKILRSRGYRTVAMHGYKGDFYNRRAMMQAYGFERFFSEEDYSMNELASGWLSDESFFKQSAARLYDFDAPFFAFLISLTSHFPFQLESKHRRLKLSSDTPELLADYYQSARYTDHALEAFYQELEAAGIAKKTVFVFYGDHEGIPPEALSLLDRDEPEGISRLPDNLKRMRASQVPFILAVGDPDRRRSLCSDRLGSTVDIGQTILHLLGLPRIEGGFGESLLHGDLDSKKRSIPLVQYPAGSFVTADRIFYAAETGRFEDGSVLNRQTLEVYAAEEADRSLFEEAVRVLYKSEYDLERLALQEAEAEQQDSRIRFTSLIEHLLEIAQEEEVVIPITYQLDLDLRAGGNDLEQMRRMEQYYRSNRHPSIRLYSTLLEEEQPPVIYFEDHAYQTLLEEHGYEIGRMETVVLSEFLDLIPDHCLIAVAARDEAAGIFMDRQRQILNDYGFHVLDSQKYRWSYLNLIYKNRGFLSLYEEVSESPLQRRFFSGEACKGIVIPVDLDMTSQGALTGNHSFISVDGVSCSPNLRGLNFVIIDADRGTVLKTARADTCVTEEMDSGMYKAVLHKGARENIG